jgi:hypothetical protein
MTGPRVSKVGSSFSTTAPFSRAASARGAVVQNDEPGPRPIGRFDDGGSALAPRIGNRLRHPSERYFRVTRI